MIIVTVDLAAQNAPAIENHLLPPIHPGEILRFELLEPYGITPYRLAKDIGVSSSRVELILDGKRAITADTAMRLSKYFGMSPQMWMNLQIRYDLLKAERDNAESYVAIKPRRQESDLT